MRRPRLSATALVFLLPFTGCRNTDDQLSGPAPPPAALIAPVRETMSLEQRLELLEGELSASIAGELLGPAVTRVVRAEAITDRLLEAEVPHQWIGEGYAVESRLRQVQTSADRILARVRRGDLRSEVMEEVKSLHEDVAELRADLRRVPTHVPPPPADSAEEAGARKVDPSARPPSRPRRRAPVDEDRLLGVPVPDGD